MSNQVVGVAPGLILLPAREYVWELKKRVQFKIPIEGKISDSLQEGELAEGVKIVGNDDFIVFEDNLLSLWEIPRILFALKMYPQLEPNQAFNVTTLEMDEEFVTIYGEIIESVQLHGEIL